MKRPWKVGWPLLITTLLLGVFVFGLTNKTASAANPTTMSFQGKVVNANGTNVSDGTYSFVFKLYTTNSGGSPIWTETQGSVTVTSGVFQVDLGSSCLFFTSNACNNSTPIDFNAINTMYMGITFNGDPAGEMSPRVHMQSVPYAFNSDRVGGLTVSQLVQLSPGSQQTGFVNVSGTINGATLSGSAVNGLTFSGTAITGSSGLAVAAGGSAQNITIDGSSTGKVQIGATSSGNIEFGGGSGGSGCTITNSNGNFLCDGTINGALLSGGTISGGTLTSSAVNSLNVSGTAISGSGSGLAISAGGTAQNLTIDAATSGKVQIGATSTGDIEIGGGSGSNGCTITNSNGNLACAGSVSATGGSLKTGSTSTAGSIVLNDGTGGGNAVTINTPTLSSAYSLTLPSSGPAVSQCLQTDTATASQLVFGSCIPLAQKLMQTYNTYAINQAASATTAMNYLLPTTATAFSIALAGTTEFKAAAAGSFRSCTLINSAAVVGGSVSIHFRKNGADVSANNYCTLNTTNTRTNSQSVASGVETFAAGDTIGVALVSSTLNPITSEHWATFTIEYGSGGNTPTSLQDAYNNGGSITTQDATDLSFNLSNTATDANYLINIATGSTGRFAVQNNGTDTFSVAQNGAVTSTGTINGQTISSAANLTGTLAVTTSVTVPTITSTAGLAITGGTTLTLSSTGVNAASLDSGTTGAVNVGTGNNAKSVNIGTGTAGNAINIGTNNTTADTIGIGSALDTLNITSSKFSVIGASGNLSTGGGTVNGATISGGTISGGTLTASAVNSLNVSGTAISGTGALTVDANGANTVSIGATSTGDILLGGGSGSTGCTITNATGVFACTSTINGATLSSTAVNGLTFSGTAIAGSGALTVDANGANSISLGATSTGDILLGGGSGATGCTVTNATGVFTCSSTINGATLSASAVNGLTFSGTAITGSGALTVDANGANTIGIGGTSTGDINLGGGSGSTGCTLTNSSGNFACTGTINGQTLSAAASLTGSLTVATGLSLSAGNLAVSQAAGNQVTLTASAVPTADQLSITNTGTTGVTTAGVSGLQISYKGGAAAVEASAQRIDLTPGTTTGGTWNGIRIVGATTSTGVIENAIKVDNVTAGAGTENAIFLGTGWDNLLQSTNVTITQAGAITAASTINGATISSTAVNGLTFSGTAVTGSGALTVDANGANTISLGATSTGDILLGGGSGSTGCTVTNASGNFACAGTITGTTLNGTTGINTGAGAGTQRIDTSGNLVAIGNITGTGAIALAAGGAATNLTLNGATTGQVLIGGTSSGDILIGGGSGATGCTVTNATGVFACTSTINGATITGGSLSGTAVNNLNVSGTAISGTGALTVDANGANTVSIGATSTGDILLGGGSGSTGCTVTNATGVFACSSTINGATLSASAVNGLTFSGTAITGSGALAITSGGTAQNLTLNGTTTGQVIIGGTSTGDVVIAGGSGATGCTVTNSTGALACASTINGITGFAFNGTAGLTKSCTTAGTTMTIQGGIITANNCTASDSRLKQNIVALDDNVLDKIKNVNVVNYDFRCDTDFFTVFNNTCPTDQQSGVIAQDLAQIFPNLVHQYGPDEGNYFWVDYQALSVYNLKAVAEIAQHIDSAGNGTFSNVSASDSVVTPKLVSDGALAIVSGKDDNITVDSKGVGLAEINIGSDNAKAVNISKAGTTTSIKGALVAEGSTDLNGNVTMHFTSPEVGFKIDNNGSAQPVENAINIKDSGSGYKKIINSTSFSVAGNGDVVTNGNVIARGGTMQILSTDGQQLITFDQTGSASFKGNLNLASASLSGGLSVAGDLNVAGLSTFQKMATFFARVIFKQDVEFQGHITVSKDSAGYALLHTGESKVHVKFNTPYATPPIVNINATDGQFATASIKDVTETGFDILLKDPAVTETKLNWTAIGVADPVVATTSSP